MRNDAYLNTDSLRSESGSMSTVNTPDRKSRNTRTGQIGEEGLKWRLAASGYRADKRSGARGSKGRGSLNNRADYVIVHILRHALPRDIAGFTHWLPKRVRGDTSLHPIPQILTLHHDTLSPAEPSPPPGG